jgi:hypothetical protein
MSAIVSDPHAPRLAAITPRRITSANDADADFAKVLAAVRGEHAAGFAETGPFGLARPECGEAQSSKSEPRRHLTPRHEVQPALVSPTAAQTSPIGQAPPMTTTELAQTAPLNSRVSDAHQVVSANQEGTAQSRISPPLSAPRTVRSAAEAQRIVAQAMGARQSSPLAVHIAHSTDAMQVYVRVDDARANMAALRGDIEALFAERGVRIQLHINGRRASGDEDHG